MCSNLNFFKNNPPSCLDGFDVKHIEILDTEFDGHGEETNPIFQLKCKCGCNTFNVSGHNWANPDASEILFVSPLSAKCTGCSSEAPIFDIQKNGYDAVLGHGCFSARGEGRPEVFKCPSCQKSSDFEIFARFEYTDDLFDDDFEEFRGQEKDLFSWFSLHGKCKSCGNTIDISEDECA